MSIDTSNIEIHRVTYDGVVSGEIDGIPFKVEKTLARRILRNSDRSTFQDDEAYEYWIEKWESIVNAKETN